MMELRLTFLLFIALTASAVNGIRLFQSPGNISASVPAACRAALSSNVACTGPESFITAQGVVTGDTLLDPQAASYCTAGCLTALQNFKRNVDQRCGSTLYKMVDESPFEQSGAVLAMNVVVGYSLACITDSEGFCIADLFNGTKEVCSDCSLKYLSSLLSSDFGSGMISNDSFSSLLTGCGASPTQYPYTYTPLPTPSAPSLPTPTDPPPSCMGTNYTVQSGDTCGSISLAQSVATDRLAALNGLDYNCTTLTAGRTLCIQDKCDTLHTVQAGDTCAQLLAGKAFTQVQLISWNPSIHYDCDNLDGMIGRNICLSPPGGGGFEVSPTSTKAPESLATSMISSWIDASWTTNPPNQTTIYSPTSTTVVWVTTTVGPYNETRANLTDHAMRFCWLREEELTNNEIVDFLPGGCVRLMETYCNGDPDIPAPTSGPAVVPAACTPTRTTSTPPPEPPPPTPTPTQEGMVRGCREFYRVISGDNCDKIRTQFGITLDEFYAWNPAIGNTCAGLWSGYYVCVKGPTPT